MTPNMNSKTYIEELIQDCENRLNELLELEAIAKEELEESEIAIEANELRTRELKILLLEATQD